MADPAPKANSIKDTIGAIVSPQSGQKPGEFKDAKLMLALAQRVDASPAEMAVAAKTAYDRWFNEQAKTMPREVMNGATPGAAVREAMAAELIDQMTVMNGGKAISKEAQAQIKELLLNKDAEGFAKAIVGNREANLKHEGEKQAAARKDPPKTLADSVGILAMLASGSSSGLGNINVDKVDLSPVGQAEANEYSVFGNVFRLNSEGYGAESTLAMIKGTPRKDWGPYNEKTGGYKNLTEHSSGAGGLDQDGKKAFWTGPEGEKVIAAMEDRGIVSFSNPGAREAYVNEMIDALSGDDPVKSANDLTERMRTFAESRSDITMESEVARENDISPVAGYVAKAEGRQFLNIKGAEAKQAFAVEAEKIFEEHGRGIDFKELVGHAEGFVAEYNAENPGAIVINHDNIDAAKAAYDAGAPEREARAAERVSAEVERVVDQHIERNSVPYAASDDRAGLDVGDNNESPVETAGLSVDSFEDVAVVLGHPVVGGVVSYDTLKTDPNRGPVQLAFAQGLGVEMRAGQDMGVNTGYNPNSNVPGANNSPFPDTSPEFKIG